MTLFNFVNGIQVPSNSSDKKSKREMLCRNKERKKGLGANHFKHVSTAMNETHRPTDVRSLSHMHCKHLCSTNRRLLCVFCACKNSLLDWSVLQLITAVPMPCIQAYRNNAVQCANFQILQMPSNSLLLQGHSRNLMLATPCAN